MKTAKYHAGLLFGALLLIAGAGQAATSRDVTCANGRTVQATDSETPTEACLKVASRPVAPNTAGYLRIDGISGEAEKAKKYERLAAQHKPRNPQQDKLVKEYMRLPASQRNAFKAQNPKVQKSIWDYGPYAVCFYASVAGGADVVEAGDECHADWVE